MRLRLMIICESFKLQVFHVIGGLESHLGGPFRGFGPNFSEVAGTMNAG